MCRCRLGSRKYRRTGAKSAFFRFRRFGIGWCKGRSSSYLSRSSRQTSNRDRLDVVPIVFFFNDTATTEIYTLSLHDALPISARRDSLRCTCTSRAIITSSTSPRSEKHTSELQSRLHLVCRLLLEKKKK